MKADLQPPKPRENALVEARGRWWTREKGRPGPICRRAGLPVFVLAEAYAALHRPDIYLGLVARSALSGRLARVSLPGTGDEIVAWRKYFDRDPRLTLFSGKLAANDWVRGLGLDLDSPGTLWTGTHPQAIPAIRQPASL